MNSNTCPSILSVYSTSVYIELNAVELNILSFPSTALDVKDNVFGFNRSHP